MQPSLSIDVYFDLICPWCLIGKRHLSQAMAQLQQDMPQVEIEVAWHSVQLLAHLPDEGVDFTSFYIDRLGSAEAVRLRQAQVNQAAAGAGVHINFSRIARMPNTRKAHQLLAFAAGQLAAPQLDTLLERLLAAHFSQGKDLSDPDLLRGLAAEQHLDLIALDAWMAAGRGQPEPIEVPGVPFFVFNRLVARSGAQAPAILLDAMRQALAKARQGEACAA